MDARHPEAMRLKGSVPRVWGGLRRNTWRLCTGSLLQTGFNSKHVDMNVDVYEELE